MNSGAFTLKTTLDLSNEENDSYTLLLDEIVFVLAFLFGKRGSVTLNDHKRLLENKVAPKKSKVGIAVMPRSKASEALTNQVKGAKT